jgi:hypothetical protein
VRDDERVLLHWVPTRVWCLHVFVVIVDKDVIDFENVDDKLFEADDFEHLQDLHIYVYVKDFLLFRVFDSESEGLDGWLMRQWRDLLGLHFWFLLLAIR